jgi:hypothetical protein
LTPVSLRKSGLASGRAFKQNLDRANRLLYIFDHVAESGNFRSKHTVTLLESAIIFAVGALDAYLHDIILEIVPAYALPSARNSYMRGVLNRDPALLGRLVTVREEVERRAELGRALADSIAKTAFHGPEAVEETLKFLDCEIGWQSFNAATGVRNTRSELDRITKLRHGLVHRFEGPRITRDEAAAALKLIENIKGLINQRVQERFQIP